jgi:hypothetical protein
MDAAVRVRKNIQAEKLRDELSLLIARYDSGAVSPAVYAVIRAIESDIAWLEHRG